MPKEHRHPPVLRPEVRWLGVDMCVFHDMRKLAAIFEVGDAIAVFCKPFRAGGSHIVSSPSLHDSVIEWVDAGHLTIVPGAMMDPR